MIDLCAGTGAFSYAFRKAFKKAEKDFSCIYANDICNESKQIYDLNHKNKLSVGDINKIKSKTIPKHSLLTAGFPCFVAGTPVLTDTGYKSIEEVTLIDKLMSHTGKFCKIINLQKKQYRGDLYHFHIKYHYENIICTEEHPFYVRTQIKHYDSKTKIYTYTYDEPEWITAKNINYNHYFGMVINNKSIIPEFEIERKINATKINYINIKLDNIDYWYLMGYFIGDGWIEDTKKSDGRLFHKIRFAINNKDEKTVLPRLRKVLNITDKKCGTGKCSKYGCCDVVWYTILKKFGKYAHGKFIPEWVQNAPIRYIKKFIQGYIDADGCVLKNGTRQITTVSLNLALGIQRLLLKLGIIAGIDKFKRPSVCIIQGRIVNQRDTYSIRIITDKKRNVSSFIEDGYVWYKLFNKTKTNVNNKSVYNFEVKKDNSYIVQNSIVHNCQSFSISGKQLGFADVRSNVFWSIVKILQKHNPDIFVLENVKNLQSHDKGNTFKIIYASLKKLGYHIKYKVLNTCKITKIPQNRERIYIVGFKNRDHYRKFHFNFEEVKCDNIIDYLEDVVDKKYYYDKRFKVFDMIKKEVKKPITKNVLYQYRRFYVRECKSGVCPTLTANMGGGGHNVGLLLDKKGIRKLTPRECFNLQGFPKNYKLPELSDSKLYKLAGNAVSVPVVQLIAEKILIAID